MTDRWRVLPVSGRLFESARWLEHEQCFQWVDILGARIYRWVPGTETPESVDLGLDFLSLATPSPTVGVQLLASLDTVYTYRWGEEPEPFAVLPVGPRARLNDGIVDGAGRLWIGSMGLIPNLEQPLGRLWRVGPDGAIAEMAEGLGISNGLTWVNETDGFHVDSLAGALYSVCDRGSSLSQKVAMWFSRSVEPDGILLADGIVWIALWDGRALGRFDPSTRQYSEVAVPASRPSSLAMSSELVLVTTAGRGSGNHLDSSGSVIVNSIDSLGTVGSPVQRERLRVGV